MTSLNIHPILESDELTMTSLEVSELTKIRHPDVLRKIRELSGKGIIRSFEQIAQKHEGTKKGGRPMKLYRLNKTESINLVAYLCPEFTARIIDRWLELEQRLVEPTYNQLQDLSVEMRVSERMCQIGSGLMNERKRVKRKLVDKENRLLSNCQLMLDLDAGLALAAEY